MRISYFNLMISNPVSNFGIRASRNWKTIKRNTGIVTFHSHGNPRRVFPMGWGSGFLFSENEKNTGLSAKSKKGSVRSGQASARTAPQRARATSARAQSTRDVNG